MFQSKEKDGYPTEHSSQAPSCAPQVSAPRYTAQPGGMAYAPQEGVPGYTQRDTVIVTQPGVETSQQQPVPPSHIGLSICSCLCCCWCLGELKFDVISKDLLRDTPLMQVHKYVVIYIHVGLNISDALSHKQL